MSKPNIRVEINEKALRNLVNERVGDFLKNEGVGYDCPECGEHLTVTIGANTCPGCGFVINVQQGELEL